MLNPSLTYWKCTKKDDYNNNNLIGIFVSIYFQFLRMRCNIFLNIIWKEPKSWFGCIVIIGKYLDVSRRHFLQL